MTQPTLKQLLENARKEMGPEVFQDFCDDLAGRPRKQPNGTLHRTVGSPNQRKVDP